MKPIVFLFLLFLAFDGNAQSIFKGKVVDSGKLPLPGVVVSVRGASARTVTDQQGNFSVKLAPTDSVLVFQFVGYLTKDIQICGWQGPVMLIEDQESLEKIVIVCDNKEVPGEIVSRVKSGFIPLYYNGQSRYYRGPFRHKKPVVTGIGTKLPNGIVY